MEKSSKQKPLLANKSAFSKALVVNLGCPKNLVDTEKVCAVLIENGVSIVSEKENFDCVFINTCCMFPEAIIVDDPLPFDAIQDKYFSHPEG